MDVLCKHALPKLVGIQLVALRDGSAHLGVRQFQQILEPNAVGIRFAQGIGLIDEHSGIRNRPKLRLFCQF
jgi:hypothetical protein